MTYLSFPRQHARTQRFTLGAPRSFAVAPGGERVAFLRSRSGTDTAHLLWVLDLPADGGTPSERIAADPAELLGGSQEDLPAAEKARRERSREGSAGVVAYAVDGAAETAAFALSGRLFTASLLPGGGGARELAVPGPVVDPRPSPDGRWVAYAAGGALRVVAAADGSGERIPLDGVRGRALAEPDGEQVTWGLAEFVAAEEMGRDRGFWWAPDSSALLAARVDESAVQRRWISEPSRPEQAPVEVAYPAAGTPNADVSLALLGLDGSRLDIEWDRERFPYLAAVHWTAAGPPVLLVQARDQRTQHYLTVDLATGATSTAVVEEDRIWLDLFPGVPALRPDGTLLRITDTGGARVLTAGEKALTGGELHIRAVLDAGGDDVLVSASAGPEAADPETGQIHVHRVTADGTVRVTQEPGVHVAVRAGEVTVLVSTAPDSPGATARVLRSGREVARIASYAEKPSLTARVTFTEAGKRGIPCAVLLPTGYAEGDGPLPVLMDPYGGPHGQRVLAAHNAHLVSQWFADQGFAVVVADGRGTPGRSPEWEKGIAGGRLAEVVLEDQIDALHALAGAFPLDLGRVAIRGWSFGGTLAALAVLRRPDVFHAGVAGAPLTDQRLYDTHYTERYLGHPAEQAAAYDRNSVVTADGIPELAEPARPLMIVHGFADDNVLVANTLRLSTALLAAGRPHEVLPLSGGITHMTPQEQVAENLLLLQVAFLRRTLTPST
ncbi:S9 family peptidase [Actinacidiphila bryophytorum]|nr:prolyl oligopeptidase family serine peptidase [Actinacidiphila bryophytorum]MBM9440025.1 prolyl oligopeptidase family serine peptidase [Actinacidiphila bryophytorum]MBN6544205.1 prolyl oligopeptidase family serine peptidase [Actinacidiphila bryophytorum]